MNCDLDQNAKKVREEENERPEWQEIIREKLKNRSNITKNENERAT